ncbi:hypothetical protein BK826_01170 [Rothia kristinae]|uniref:FHA domain-containing protein n=2 Tax=Rothia kristinae TaxID=37923 RepID=A0A1S2N2M9_9MICC|nr:hypothetical protein BK826_01170 [Rothia kristinae]QQC59820.1 FHA domain-containing protein [Rothia kristinae]
MTRGEDMSEHEQASPETTVIRVNPPQDRPVRRRLADEEAAAVAALPADSALLIAQSGPHGSARFLLDADAAKPDQGIVAGRHPDADIFLDDVTVSRRHASFSFNAGAFEITDAGSLNGTYVNGDRVDHVSLQDGDEVRIGKFVFVFCAGRSR